MGERIIAAALFCLLLPACGPADSDSNSDFQNRDVSPAETEFEFGPVEIATESVGIGSDPQGAQFLAAEVDRKFYFATRDDVGSDWTELETPFEAGASTYVYADGVHLIDFGEEGMFRSTDGAATWTELTNDFRSSPFKVLDAFHVVEDDMLKRSPDGGETWIDVGQLPYDPSQIPALEVASNGHLYLTQLGKPAHRSTDGGVSWTEITLPNVSSVADFHAVVDPNGNVLEYAKSSGVELYSRAADGTWNQVALSADFPTFRLFHDAFWFDGAVYLVFSDGRRNHIASNANGDWEVVWSDSVAAETFLDRISFWKDHVTLVFNRLGHTIVQVELGERERTDEIRFETEHAPIRGVSLLEHDGSIKALISVYRPLGVFGDLDTRVPTFHEIFWSESADGAEWTTPRSLAIGTDYRVEDAIDSDGSRLIVLDATDGLAVQISDDDGATFDRVEIAELDRIVRRPSIRHVTGDMWFIVSGDGGYFRSSDRGESWSPVSTNDLIVTAADGRLVGVDYDVQPYESTDGGQTWDELPGAFPLSESDLRFDGDGIRRGRLHEAGGSVWYICCGWNVIQSGSEWSLVDTRNDLEVVDVVGGHAGVHFYGNDPQNQEMVVIRKDNSFVYVSADLAGEVEEEHAFVEAAYFEGAHIIAITDRDRRRLSLLRRDPDDFTKGR